jgi:hypothetical protein
MGFMMSVVCPAGEGAMISCRHDKENWDRSQCPLYRNSYEIVTMLHNCEWTTRIPGCYFLGGNRIVSLCLKVIAVGKLLEMLKTETPRSCQALCIP